VCGAPRRRSPTLPLTLQSPSDISLGLFAKSTGATLVEGAAIHRWLRLRRAGRPWRGLASLAAGETLETVALVSGIRREASKRWGELEPTERAHSDRVARITGAAGILEIGVWETWVASVHGLQAHPRPRRIIAGGTVLLVLMHAKHQVEGAAIRDTPFRTGLLSPREGFASAMEVAGAVACLALIEDGHVVLAGAALGGGLMIEHLVLLRTLSLEIEARDIRRPRKRRRGVDAPPRWRRRKRSGRA
jgi:hypothetical protein